MPTGSISEADFLSILLEPPAWADGLPLAGKVWSGSHYLEPPEEPTPASDSPIDAGGPARGRVRDRARRGHRRGHSAIPAERGQSRQHGLRRDVAGDDMPPLFDLVSVPLTDDHKTSCPFHPLTIRRRSSSTPTTSTASAVALVAAAWTGWRRGEGMSREEAIACIRDWEGPVRLGVRRRPRKRSSRARSICGRKARPIAGTIAERYLAETRRIDVAGLPANISDSLRFHPHCPFGPGQLQTLPARPDARPRERPTDRDPPHRARAAERPRLQGRSLRPRPHGRDQALAERDRS